jgi:transcriptional regulator with XRE-family HTH domain
MAYKIQDVAKLAGVSTTTVSRVLNGSEQVTHETRTRVQAAIARVRYSPNAHAAELRRGRSTAEESGRRRRAAGLKSSSPAPQVYENATAEVARLCLLEGENRRLRQLVTRLTLDLGKLVSDLSLESK